MNDPWDVKCVRQGRQYQSCMKLNGVPLLPPLLSKECRKEMEYYKLLAQEVEKRMSALHSYISDQRGYSGDDADATDALELPECEQFKAIQNHSEPQPPEQEKGPRQNDDQTSSRTLDSEVVIDVNVKISEKKRTSFRPQDCDELPERDLDHSNEGQQEEILTDIETSRNRLIHQLLNLDIFKKASGVDQGSPSSLSGKKFTGSLNDLHGETAKEEQIQPLIRQSSYTLLNPSPQLLAHLEIQSLNTGVDVQAISMSESTTNVSPTSKKRKSWDLESAKEKWSSMALELKKNIGIKSNRPNYVATKTAPKKPQVLNRSLQEKSKKIYGCNSFAKSPKTEPLQRAQNVTPKTVAKRPVSPVQRTLKSSPSYVIDKEEKPPKENTVALISESKDPAAKVRELYEKLQKQHTMQMASLIDKQKREQHLLQQVFEDQNNLLLKQLKMVCPKATIKVKEAWGEQKDDTDGHPVSLSQLLHSTPVSSMPNSPASKTLTDTKSCLNKCDNVLKHSRDIINSIKKGPQATRAGNVNGIKNPVANNNKQATHARDTTSSRSASPSHRNASRRLNYDTSASTEYEPMLTDRTNDTMADLNVTFPSDNEEVTAFTSTRANSPERAASPVRSLSPKRRSANNTIRSYEEAIHSMRNVKQSNLMCRTATAEERAAATKIVAYAKGYLVRRLLRTERVQATVQTIKDALLCALQLHQDREGIRGADVDLHRRLIQQITAACYSLHDTFVGCSTADRCALISADRSRKMALATKPLNSARNRDVMSQSHSGVFPSRPRPASAGQMSRSYYATETTSSEHPPRPRYVPVRRPRPWR